MLQHDSYTNPSPQNKLKIYYYINLEIKKGREKKEATAKQTMINPRKVVGQSHFIYSGRNEVGLL